ncbi:hypothetical protein ACOMHN_055786 [Nucella lapillus]
MEFDNSRPAVQLTFQGNAHLVPTLPPAPPGYQAFSAQTRLHADNPPRHATRATTNLSRCKQQHNVGIPGTSGTCGKEQTQASGLK